MKSELKETGNLMSQLTIVLEQGDYKSAFDKEMNKYKKEAGLKGFRKGKTPLSVIRKFYGKSILAKIVDETLQEKMRDVIKEKELSLITSPILSEDQSAIDFDVKNLVDFTFVMDLGHKPDFDIMGIAESDTYDRYKIEVNDEMIEERLSELAKQGGKQEEVKGPVVKGDIINIDVSEKEVPEGREGYTNEVKVFYDKLTEEYQDKIHGALLGDNLDVNPFNLEQDAAEDYVKKYFIPEAPEDLDPEMKGTVASITRLNPAEINQELFDKVFGPDQVKGIDEAKAKLKEETEKHYDLEAFNLSKAAISKQVREMNELELPREFVKKSMLVDKESVSEEEVDDYMVGLRWYFVKEKIAEQNEINISMEDLKQDYVQRLYQQFGSYQLDPSFMMQMADRMTKNEEQVAQQHEMSLSNRVMDKIAELVTLNDKVVTFDEFKKIAESMS